MFLNQLLNLAFSFIAFIIMRIHKYIYFLSNRQMGIRPSSHIPNPKSLFKNFKHEDWIEIKTNNNSVDPVNLYGEYTTLRNLITDQQIDMFFLYFENKQQFMIYIECFMERIRENYLVNAIYLQPFTSREGCTSYYTAKCYLQHIPIRLSNITDIPFLDTLYILLCCLLGFQKLFNNVGYFSVAEDHICIDKQGEVRVWMNTDLSKNYPQTYEQIGTSKEGQNAMVTEIIDLIFNNSEDISQQQQIDERIISFREYLQLRESNPSFKQVLQQLYKYLKEYEIQLPNYCQSILEIFNEENASYFLPNNDSGIERMLDGSLNSNMSNNDLILNESNMFARKQKKLIRHRNDRNLQRVQEEKNPHQISSSSKSKFFRNSYRANNSQRINQPQKQRRPFNSKRLSQMQSSRSQSNNNMIQPDQHQGMDYLEMSNLSSNHNNQPIDKIPIRNHLQAFHLQGHSAMQQNFRGSINNSQHDYLNHACIQSERGFRFTQNTNSHIDNYSRPDHYLQRNENIEQIPTQRVSHRGSHIASYKGNLDQMIMKQQNNRKRFSEQRNSYKIKFTYMGMNQDQNRGSIDQINKGTREELEYLQKPMLQNKTDQHIFQTANRQNDKEQVEKDEREIDPEILADLKQYQSQNCLH